MTKARGPYQTKTGEAITIGDWTWRAELLESKVVKQGEDEHWGWTGSRGPSGNLFGAAKAGRKQMTQAVRLYYQQLTGIDCRDLQIKHSCADKYCMNPAHWYTKPNNKFFRADGTPNTEPKPEPEPKQQPARPVTEHKTKKTYRKANQWWTE